MRRSARALMTLRAATLCFIINDMDFFVSHRLHIAKAAMENGYQVSLLCPLSKESLLEVQKAGINHIDIPFVRSGITPFADLKSLVHLWKTLREIKPRLVHNITIKAAVWGSLAARFAKVPFIVNSVPGLGTLFSKRQFGKNPGSFIGTLLYRVSLPRKNHKIIFQNEDDRLYFIKAGLADTESCKVIPGSGVPENGPYPFPGKDAPFSVIMACRLLKAKGVLDFMKAAQIVRRTRPDTRFFLCGRRASDNPDSIDDTDFEMLRDSGDISFIENCDNVPALIRDSHLACLPSYYGEGVPRFLVEAAAAGRPAVACDIPGVRQLLCNDRTPCGIFVPRADPGRLASAIEKLIGDDEELLRLGANARKTFETGGYSSGEVVASHLKIYRDLTSTS